MYVVNVKTFLVPIAICFYKKFRIMVNIIVNNTYSFSITLTIPKFLSSFYFYNLD